MNRVSSSISRSMVPGRRLRLTLAAAVLGAAGVALATGSAVRDVLAVPAVISPQSLRSAMSGIASKDGRALAVGPRGIILLSRDGGRNWSQIVAPVSADFTTVRFGAGSTAWALGHDAVVLRSDNGGETWSRVMDGHALFELLSKHYGALANAGNEEAERVLRDVEMAAEQSATPGVLAYPFLDIHVNERGEGFLAGAFGLLLHTTDGGTTWEPWIERADNGRRMHLYAIEPTPDGGVFLAGEQGLVRRLDRDAARFETIETPYKGTYFGITAGHSKLIAYGLRGNAFISRDGATSWSSLAMGSDASVVAALERGAGRLVFVTQSGQVLLSNDDGASVAALEAPRGGEVFAAAMAGPEELLLARVNGVDLIRLPLR